MQPETQLVIELSRTPTSAAARDRVMQLLGAGVNWGAVRDITARWQVEPSVFGNLRTHFAAAIPDAILSDLALRERDVRALALTRTLVLMDLVRGFEGAGIPVMVLKGPAVAILAYGDYTRRPFGDVDLLLRREDLAKGRDFLLARGFARDFPPEIESALVEDQHALEFSDARTKVELHWSLLSRHLRFDLSIDQLWDEAQEVECMGSAMRVLSSHHLFLYLCAHGTKHEWMLFRWVLDVAQLAQRLGPGQSKRVMELAAESNGRRILALALRLIADTFGDDSTFPPGAKLPERDTRVLASVVRARLEPGSEGSSMLLPPAVARIHPYLGPLAFWIRSRERTRDQIGCAAQFVFAPAASDGRRGVMNGLLRPARLASNAIRKIARFR